MNIRVIYNLRIKIYKMMILIVIQEIYIGKKLNIILFLEIHLHIQIIMDPKLSVIR
jgi:hypothetical protein